MAKALLVIAGALGCWFLGFALPSHGADLDEVRQQYIQGHYSNCIHLCEQAIGQQEYNEEWRLLLVQSLMTLGQ